MVTMAEHFRGRDHTAHFTNGGGEQLLVALVQAGEKMAASPDLEAVLGFLRERLNYGSGCRSFDLWPPPEELASPGRLRCLAALVARFADDLARGQPDPRLDVVWGRGLELSWLARVITLYELINEALPAGAEPLAALALPLTAADRAQCDYERLASRLAEHCRRVERGLAQRDPNVELRLLGRMLAALADLGPSRERASLASQCLARQCDLLLGLGDREGATLALREAVAQEPDEEMRRGLAEYLALVEEDTGGYNRVES